MSGDDADGLVKNVFYTLQADYSAYKSTLENPNHGKDYFRYGYVGKFTPSVDNETFTNTAPWNWEAYDVYVLDSDGNKIPVLNSDGDQVVDDNGNLLWQQETQTGVLVDEHITYDFEASDANPLLANYTQSYYDFFHANVGENLNPTLDHIGFSALRNGDTPPDVYGLWWNLDILII